MKIQSPINCISCNVSGSFCNVDALGSRRREMQFFGCVSFKLTVSATFNCKNDRIPPRKNNEIAQTAILQNCG
jgi:hypothetical protein